MKAPGQQGGIGVAVVCLAPFVHEHDKGVGSAGLHGHEVDALAGAGGIQEEDLVALEDVREGAGPEGGGRREGGGGEGQG